MHQIKVGFEVEGFAIDTQITNRLTTIPKNIPQDACGYLWEARGTPSTSVYQAWGSMLGEVLKISQQLDTEHAVIDNSTFYLNKTPKEFKPASNPQSTTKRLGQAYTNVYTGGFFRFSKPIAGMHIHFSTHAWAKEAGYTVAPSLDVVRIVRQLDSFFYGHNNPTLFATGNRPKGLYRIKPYGFEYISPSAAWRVMPETNQANMLEYIKKLMVTL